MEAEKEPMKKAPKLSNPETKTVEVKKVPSREAPSPKPTTSKEPNKSTHESQLRPREVAFAKLFSGVRLVLSGYQNPERGQLRELALGMGAEYRPDWGPGCTHLICAVKGTPKYNQVKGRGKIVKRQWLSDSYKQRKRLSWRKYAFEEAARRGADSEEEILASPEDF